MPLYLWEQMWKSMGVEPKRDTMANMMHRISRSWAISVGSDEEFSLSGKAFVDANAHHYLAIEAAGGACAAVVQQLINLKNGDPPEHG